MGVYLAAQPGGHHEAEAAHGAVNAITGHAAAASHEAAGHAVEEHHVSWLTRIWANIWVNAVYFTGISVVGMFFISYNYLAQAGWSAVFKRVPEAMPAFLPITGVIMLLVFIFGGHDLFHWTHSEVYEVGGPEYDRSYCRKTWII